MRKIFAAAGAAVVLMTGLGATTAATAAVPAVSARPAPVIYGTFGNWRGPRIEPRNQAMGAAFVLIKMRWTRWNGSSARAGGTDQIGGNATTPIHYWPSTITLYRVRAHHGHPYYSRMTIASHGHRTLHLHYWGSNGGWFQ
jgi:hypothetical protein